MNPFQIAEFQGLYGPFTLSERVIQKVWLRQDFASASLKTVSGKKLVVKNPGRWNFHEGPDFKEARLVLDGVELIGDVEVHLNLLDWRHHRHENDKNYDRVLLHVVLQLDPANSFSQVQTSKGDEPELLHLLPFLNQDLESCALEDALLELECQDELEWVARFVQQPLKDQLQILNERALVRWQQKRVYAQQRLDAEGWEAACHSYVLEVLGYRRNRTPMLKLAMRYPLAQMREVFFEYRSADDRNSFAAQLFEEEAECWKLNGLRPANHPRRRLAQYLEIVSNQPDWPDRLTEWIERLPVVVDHTGTHEFRKATGLSGFRSQLSESVFGSVVGEKRLNTLAVDMILPLATAAGLMDAFDYWRHWFPGDSPDSLSRFLKKAGVVDHQKPLSNGLIQGALGLFLDHDA